MSATTMNDLVVFVDSRERDVWSMCESFVKPCDYKKCVLEVGDVIICRKYDARTFGNNTLALSSASTTTSTNASPPPTIAYDPIRSLVHVPDASAATASNDVVAALERLSLSNEHVYVPLVVVERKSAADLASSVMGKTNKPGFCRYKDQKLRMKEMRRQTGCMLLLIVENFMAHANKQFVGRMQMSHFDHVLLHTVARDDISVHHTRNIADTLHVIAELCKLVVQKQYANPAFEMIYRFVRANAHHVQAGMPVDTLLARARLANSVQWTWADSLPSEDDDDNGEENIQHFPGREMEAALGGVRTAHPTANIIVGHDQIVSMRKADNMTPAICFQSQLMSVRGVSEVIAKSIIVRYAHMAALFTAYFACRTEDEKMLMLQKVERITGKTSSKGKVLCIGKVLSRKIYNGLHGIEENSASTIIPSRRQRPVADDGDDGDDDEDT
jgi:ERCC4-type nuclease